MSGGKEARQPDAGVDVLIVGAGPVGLALAVELGLRGIDTRVVEQHDRVGRQPRAKTTNVRTMEHMRRWGLAEKIVASSPLPSGYGNSVIFATRMFGETIVEIENALNARPDREEIYAQGAQWIPQYVIEDSLREKVQNLPACRISFRTKFVSAAETPDGVSVTIEGTESGEREVVSAKYLVGADGGRSAVRDLLGFKMEGRRGFGAFLNLVLKIPALADAHPQPPAIMYWLVNEEAPAVMGPMDTDDVWYWVIPLADDRVPSEPEVRELVARSIGQDMDFEILLTDPWFAHRLVANRYSAGRIFLAGDACHLHPPFGGFGMNMGVGDAVDLGWKLAAVLDGWGGSQLLASYESERRPVHQRLIDVAVQNMSVLNQHLFRPGLETPGAAGDEARRSARAAILEHKVQEFHSLGVVLGHTYSGSPLVVADGTSPPEPEIVNYTPSAHPGCRAPHCWLPDGTSLYDAFGAGFTLLATAPFGESEVAPMRTAAREMSVPLDVIAPGDDRLGEMYQAKFALIRPDQHVAWRGNTPGDDARSILDTARGVQPAPAQDRLAQEPLRA